MPDRGLIDTSIVIDLPRLTAKVLPAEMALSAITLAELAAGPHATDDVIERGARQAHLQWVEATFDPLPFDAEAARAYGQLYAGMRASGRSSRRRLFDLMIAASALAHDLPLFTRNPDDVSGLDTALAIVAV